jgi:histidine triad (HIT) family protein
MYNEVMEDSVFTKIIKGQLPSYKVYEDEKTIAIIPLHPTSKGHVLVIPKLQIDNFYDLPDDEYAALWSTVKKVSKKIKTAIYTNRVGIKVIGLDVPHVHVHVIGFDTLAEFNNQEDLLSAPDQDKLKAMAELLKI